MHAYWAANLWALYGAADCALVALLPRLGIPVQKPVAIMTGAPLPSAVRFSGCCMSSWAAGPLLRICMLLCEIPTDLIMHTHSSCVVTVFLHAFVGRWAGSGEQLCGAARRTGRALPPAGSGHNGPCARHRVATGPASGFCCHRGIHLLMQVLHMNNNVAHSALGYHEDGPMGKHSSSV